MYSARFADLKLKKSQLDQLQNSNLDSSYYSNKSKKSVKEHLAEFRNQSPGSTSRPISANSGQNSKVKLMLNQLVSGDLARHKEEKLNTQLFTQNLLKPKLEKTTSTKNLTKQTQPKFQTKLKPSEILTNREKTVDRSNVYFMFNNKQSEPQIKPISNNNKSNNLMTLSQLAQQCKQKTSKNTTPQRKPDQVSNYLEQIQQLKQQFENSSSKKVTVPVDTTQERQLKSHKAKSQNNSQEKENNIVKLYLQKEYFWYSLLRDIENPKEVAKLSQQLQVVIRDISEKQNSEYLFRINPHLVDTILLESYTLLIIAVEYLKLKQQSDLNQKNLVQYITQSNLFSLQLLNIQFNNEQIQQRVEQRQTANRKVQNGRQSLQKNNYIVRSILELIIDDTSRPDIYTQLGFNMNSLDLFLIQQKKILSQIAMEINTDISTETNDTNLLPQKPAKQYTLVLDLDETLVHYQEFPNGGGQFLVRPYAEEFLKAISKYYEIVIFTAAMPDYANFIIDIIDKSSVVSARLFREHTLFKDNVHIKDLSILGRSLAKTIIVDNMPENFQLQPENGIFIQGWYGEQKDRALKDLQPLLEEIAIKKCKDVRLALNCFREQMIERVQLGIKNPYTNLQLN